MSDFWFPISVWCLMSDVWYLIYIWCLMSEVWCLMSDVRRLVSRSQMSDVWCVICLVSDVRRLMSADLRRLISAMCYVWRLLSNMSGVWCQMSDVWCLKSYDWCQEVRCQTSDVWYVWCLMSDVWCQQIWDVWFLPCVMSDVCCLICLVSDVRCQTSYVWSHMSGVKKSDVRLPICDICLMLDVRHLCQILDIWCVICAA